MKSIKSFLSAKILLVLLSFTSYTLDAQVTAPTPTPSRSTQGQGQPRSTGQTGQSGPGAQQGSGTQPRNQRGGQTTNPQGNQPGAQGNQQGNQSGQGNPQGKGNQPLLDANGNPLPQQNGDQPNDQQGNEEGNAEADPENADKSQLDKDLTNELTPAEKEKAELRARIFGSNLFTGDGIKPISNQPIATPLDYTVGPGDELNIYLYGRDEETYEGLIVNRDGFLTIPRAGNVAVIGRTIDEINKLLIGKLRRFIPNLIGRGGRPPTTTLTVSLGEVRQVLVYVSGQAVTPGNYTVSSLSTAFNTLYEAGGPDVNGSFREVKIVRKNRVISTFDLYDYLLKGTLEGNLRLQDNDNVYIGYYTKRVDIVGEVKNPGLYEMKEGESLKDLLEFAGGFKEDAYQSRLRISSYTDTARSISTVAKDSFDMFQLRDGDIITVESVLDRIENLVSIEGAVMREGDYDLENNTSLKEILENADGLREDAFPGRVTITRTNPDQSLTNISLNLTEILNGTKPDVPLQRLDVVTIPSKFTMTEESWVMITGEVNNTKLGTNQGKFPYIDNMTVKDLILKADGLKESADLSNIEIVRRKTNVDPKASDARVADTFIIGLTNTDLTLTSGDTGVMLRPFDEVIVRVSPNYEKQKFVRIEGEVLHEGAYPIVNKNDKISDIIKKAGGIKQLAYLPGATLSRITVVPEASVEQREDLEEELAEQAVQGSVGTSDGATRTQNIGIRMEKLLEAPGSREDLIVQEGDVIKIPKRLETVQVNGELQFPNTVKFENNMRMLDYISRSGGFTKTASRRGTYIRYPNGSVDRTRRFLFFNVYPKVQPGSEVFVPQKDEADLTPQQLLNQGIVMSQTLFSLIISILAFRQFSN